MDTELGGVESDSGGVLEGNVVEYSETLAVVKRKMEESDDVGESKKDSGKRRRYVLVYKEVDDVGLVESEKEEVESLVLAGVENLKHTESDLVWGKVRSYPWWPGQVSKIKPFHENFGKMVEQSNSVEFRDAVDCALEEVARRVEFGLSCACVSEEGYLKLNKTQNIVEESCVKYGGDKLSDAMFFEPAKLVEYMRNLACFPSYDATEKLLFVSNRARVLAFQQWKGYFNFLEYETFPRLVESTVSKVSLLEPNTDEKKEPDYKDDDDHKERFDSEDRTDEDSKEKTLSDFIAQKRSEGKSTEKFDGESSVSGNSEEKIKNNCPTGDLMTSNSDIMSLGDAEFDESLYSTETQKGIAESFSTDQFMKDISCSNLEEDSNKIKMEKEEQNPNPIYLVPEILEEIFLALPLKSLCKFKIVSKEWKSVIESRNFMERRMEKVEKKRTILAVGDRTGSRLQVDEEEEIEMFYVNCGEDDAARSSMSCEGLVCIPVLGWINVFNPSTREFVRFPSGPDPLASQQHHPDPLWVYPGGWTMGFGRDTVSGSYKVVRMFFNKTIHSCEILDVGTGEWRSVTPPSYSVHCSMKSVCVNGSIYWLGFLSRFCLLALDLHTERFRDVPLPLTRCSLVDQLVNLEGRLALASIANHCLDIWVLDAEEETWTLAYGYVSVLTSQVWPLVCGATSQVWYTPLAVTENGNLVFYASDKKLLKYYPDTHSVRCLSSNVSVISTFVENLLPLGCPDSIPMTSAYLSASASPISKIFR